MQYCLSFNGICTTFLAKRAQPCHFSARSSTTQIPNRKAYALSAHFHRYSLLLIFLVRGAISAENGAKKFVSLLKHGCKGTKKNQE